MTFLESLRPWQLSEQHQYGEGVRSALWRLALYLGNEARADATWACEHCGATEFEVVMVPGEEPDAPVDDVWE